MLWSDAPDPDIVASTYKELAATKAEILAQERLIEKTEDDLKDEYSRKPAERRKRMTDLLDTLTELKQREVTLEFEIKFYNIRLDMYRAFTYRKG